MFGLSIVKLVAIGIAAMALLGLIAHDRIQTARVGEWQAKYATAAAANTGLASQVEQLTGDLTAAEARAVKAAKDLANQQTTITAAVTAHTQEIDRAATDADDRPSAAVAAWFGQLRAASHNNAAPAH